MDEFRNENNLALKNALININTKGIFLESKQGQFWFHVTLLFYLLTYFTYWQKNV